MATAASRTTNPLLQLLVVGAVAAVVATRRTNAPWARGFRTYLVLGLIVIGIRVVFRVVLDAQYGRTIIFTLPQVQLPSAAAGIRIGGPVSLEGVLAALYDGIRLATLLICVGAANVLADPKRLLRIMPGALYEAGVAVTVALTLAPQLIESGQRISRARRLRTGEADYRHIVRRVVLPVVEDALDRSLVLAAAMDSKGYGRTAGRAPRERMLTSALMLLGLCGVCVGTYGLLDATTPRALGAPLLAAGCAVAIGATTLGGRRVRRTVYRPDPWRLAEWAVSACGITAAAVMFMAGRVNPADLYPTLQPLRWPNLTPLPVLAIAIGTLPAMLAPPVPYALAPRRELEAAA
jgi:energy-coupling factor transport system permease protein